MIPEVTSLSGMATVIGSILAVAAGLVGGRLLAAGVGRLVEPRITAGSRAMLWAPVVVAAAALALWEMDLATLTRTPSRLTAEPVHRDERARLLARTARDGFVDDYSGIRISSTGRRFRIEQAIVWNLVDAAGIRRGQAATFDRWTPVES